eukprot:56199-Eustigmatos_ZCMA.PRE.1
MRVLHKIDDICKVRASSIKDPSGRSMTQAVRNKRCEVYLGVMSLRMVPLQSAAVLQNGTF